MATSEQREFFRKQTAKFLGVPEETQYASVWHITSKKNHNKILSSEMFKLGTFFAPTEEVSRQYERQARPNPTMMNVTVYLGAALPTGAYLSANEDLYLDRRDGVYKPEDMFKNRLYESNLLKYINLFLQIQLN